MTARGISKTVLFLLFGAIAGYLAGIRIEHSSIIESFSGRPGLLLAPGETYPYESNPFYGWFRIGLSIIFAIIGAAVGKLMQKEQKP